MNKRLTHTQVAKVRDNLVKRQGMKCAICGCKIGGKSGKQPVLDHDHTTGFIRDALCSNCNGLEGKLFNIARRAKRNGTELEWVESLLEYYRRHTTPKHGGYLHPTYKTEAEKRLVKNKKARERRAKAKEQ